MFSIHTQTHTHALLYFIHLFINSLIVLSVESNIFPHFYRSIVGSCVHVYSFNVYSIYCFCCCLLFVFVFSYFSFLLFQSIIIAVLNDHFSFLFQLLIFYIASNLLLFESVFLQFEFVQKNIEEEEKNTLLLILDKLSIPTQFIWQIEGGDTEYISCSMCVNLSQEFSKNIQFNNRRFFFLCLFSQRIFCCILKFIEIKQNRYFNSKVVERWLKWLEISLIIQFNAE